MPKISTYFSSEETTVSDVAARMGIDNSVPKELSLAVLNTALCMDKVRILLGTPIIVNSWYRCPILNTIIGSTPASQHIRGEAVDFISPYLGYPVQVCKRIVNAVPAIPFDQLILEHTWVHISFCSNPSAKPRNAVLSLLANKTYAAGITDKNGNLV